jgi:murein DD-endopeptidase MepM/ murein hydrolase activator NlpD
VAPLRLSGVWHKVGAGETVKEVARRHGADAEAVAELNDLPPGGSLEGRAEVFVPKSGGRAPGTGAEPLGAASAVGAVPRGEQRVPASANSSTGQCVKGVRRCLAWPLRGKLTSRFGGRDGAHHDGIDIAAARGTTIGAAAGGKVLYAGDEIKGYGNLIIIRHEGGVITVYAHNEENLVEEGDEVSAGDRVASVGSTGSAKGPHLHFEVRVSEEPQDPLLYLPAR